MQDRSSEKPSSTGNEKGLHFVKLKKMSLLNINVLALEYLTSELFISLLSACQYCIDAFAKDTLFSCLFGQAIRDAKE